MAIPPIRRVEIEEVRAVAMMDRELVIASEF